MTTQKDAVLRRVLLSYRHRLYYLMNFELKFSDGSFYFSFVRNGERGEVATWKPSVVDMSVPVGAIEYSQSRIGDRKGYSISYHTSGRVNFHSRHNPPIFLEPSVLLSRPNFVCGYSVPSIERLDLYSDEISEEDYVATMSDDFEGRVDFLSYIAPVGSGPDRQALAITYQDLFTFFVVIPETPMRPPEELDKHFHFFTPPVGISGSQVIDQDIAQIMFHQRMNNTRQIILYAPNNEGEYKLICASPMRIAPDLEVSFTDPTLSVSDVKSTPSVIRFKVKNQHGHYVKRPVGIVRIGLHAEL